MSLISILRFQERLTATSNLISTSVGSLFFNKLITVTKIYYDDVTSILIQCLQIK